MSIDTYWKRAATLEDAIEHGLTPEEFDSITTILDREINLVELGVCAALYSEHCSYKSTKVHLKNLPVTGPDVLQGPGENAGAIDIGDGDAIVFKVESHNHPSFIEPYQGAATGVGGILRDIFTMGARPLALLNSLRFGDPELPLTRRLLSGAVHGIGGYGNCMGVPTIGGELFFHRAYNGNCLVNAFALGLVHKDKIFLGNAKGVGNPILYVGSKTGRDGIHGATMASDVFDEGSEERRPTVQVGDPFQEKLLLEACLEAMNTDAVVGIQDMGAAGLTSSTYEMADRAGTGVVLHLDRVPCREEGMNPYEIMLSESQERMLIVAARGKEDKLFEIFSHWELDAVQIGEVTNSGNVELLWHNDPVSIMPVSLLTSAAPEYRWPEKPAADYEHRTSIPLEHVPETVDCKTAWKTLLGSPNLCSRFPLYSQYDSTVRSNTVIHPGGDAAVIRVKPGLAYHAGSRDYPLAEKRGGVEKGVAMTLDCNSRYCAVDPRHGAALSVAEAARNITAVGAKPVGISDCLNFGSPERPEGMWEIAEAIRGMGEASRALKVPIVSGNVSLYNESRGTAILPTPLIAMVGVIADASSCVTAHFQQSGDKVMVFGETRGELGGSEYLAQVHNIEKGILPFLDYTYEMKIADFIRSLIDRKLLKSCHDISSGGLAIALVESCVTPYHAIGVTISVSSSMRRNDVVMFSESGPRYLVSMDPAEADEVTALAKKAGIVIEAKGSVGGEVIEIDKIATLNLSEATELYRHGLTSLFQ